MDESRLFVVRIYPRPAGAFFASARRVDQEVARFFRAADPLAQFLANNAPVADEPPQSPQPTP